MSTPRPPVRSMPGPSGLTGGARTVLLMDLLSAGVSMGFHAGLAWAQPGGVTVRVAKKLPRWPTSSSRWAVDGRGGVAAYQHVIEPRVKIIQIRGVDQKDYPQYDPGASTASGIDPGYERRVGIDRLGKANKITYYLTSSLNAKTVSGPDQQPVRREMVRFTLSQTFEMDLEPKDRLPRRCPVQCLRPGPAGGQRGHPPHVSELRGGGGGGSLVQRVGQ
jgi:LPS transport system D